MAGLDIYLQTSFDRLQFSSYFDGNISYPDFRARSHVIFPSLLLWNNILVVQRSFFLCWDYLLAVTIWLSLWRVKIKVSKRFSILFFCIDFDLWNILGWIYNRVYKIGSLMKNRLRLQNIVKSTKKSPMIFYRCSFRTRDYYFISYFDNFWCHG